MSEDPTSQKEPHHQQHGNIKKIHLLSLFVLFVDLFWVRSPRCCECGCCWCCSWCRCRSRCAQKRRARICWRRLCLRNTTNGRSRARKPSRSFFSLFLEYFLLCTFFFPSLSLTYLFSWNTYGFSIVDISQEVELVDASANIGDVGHHRFTFDSVWKYVRQRSEAETPYPKSSASTSIGHPAFSNAAIPWEQSEREASFHVNSFTYFLYLCNVCSATDRLWVVESSRSDAGSERADGFSIWESLSSIKFEREWLPLQSVVKFFTRTPFLAVIEFTHSKSPPSCLPTEGVGEVTFLFWVFGFDCTGALYVGADETAGFFFWGAAGLEVVELGFFWPNFAGVWLDDANSPGEIDWDWLVLNTFRFSVAASHEVLMKMIESFWKVLSLAGEMPRPRKQQLLGLVILLPATPLFGRKNPPDPPLRDCNSVPLGIIVFDFQYRSVFPVIRVVGSAIQTVQPLLQQHLI